MPNIFHCQLDKHTSLCVWHITETEEQLLEGLQLTEKDLSTILSLQLAKRRKERIACRKALSFLLKTPNLNINYGNSGEPLCEGYYISFSHSGEYAAVAVSSRIKVGIDIEVLTSRILRLFPKFINNAELESVDFLKMEDMHYFWSAKEAIFKLFPGEKFNFLNDITVNKHDNSATFVSSGNTRFVKLNDWKVEDAHLALATLEVSEGQ